MSAQNNYTKIDKQMKFKFLNKVIRQHIPVYQAARQTGINDSTAKTIIFFYKIRHKSYRSFKIKSNYQKSSTVRAYYQEIKLKDCQKQKILIVTNKSFVDWQPRKQLKSGNIELTYVRNQQKQIRKHIVRKEVQFSDIDIQKNCSKKLKKIQQKQQNQSQSPLQSDC